MQIFKERQLPLIILGIAAVLIVTIIAGSITRAVQRKQIATEASEAAAAEEARIHQEYQDILMQTEFMAVEYRYQEAIALIDSYKVLDEKGSKPVTLQLHYLSPIPYEEYKDLNTTDLAALVRGRIEAKIQESI